MQKETTQRGPEAVPVLSVKDVSYWYGSKQALDAVSFDVYRGKVTALLGPNGAGKTTLFSLITRLFDAPTGRIEIDGRSATDWGFKALEPLGVVFQQPTLDLDLTVKQNLRYFASLRGLKRKEADERMDRALTALDMKERMGEKVRALNGGHRRRVEIARALLHSPKLLLLDEPTIGLDDPTRAAIVRHIHDLARSDHIGVLWATHLFDEIESVFADFFAHCDSDTIGKWKQKHFADRYPHDASPPRLTHDVPRPRYRDLNLCVMECEQCGRLWIQEAVGVNRCQSFAPEDHDDRGPRVLDFNERHDEDA